MGYNIHKHLSSHFVQFCGVIAYTHSQDTRRGDMGRVGWILSIIDIFIVVFNEVIFFYKTCNYSKIELFDYSRGFMTLLLQTWSPNWTLAEGIISVTKMENAWLVEIMLFSFYLHGKFQRLLHFSSQKEPYHYYLPKASIRLFPTYPFGEAHFSAERPAMKIMYSP